MSLPQTSTGSAFLGVLLAVALAPAYAQRPVVYPGGVVNSASFVNKGQPTHAVAQGSIASVFGENLAPATAWADTLPLPYTLAGTSVTINGTPAPLFYVSPNQINLQVPGAVGGNPYFGGYGDYPIVVKTGAGTSDPAVVEIARSGPGIFTVDGTGCGRGLVFNHQSDGSLVLNSPENSVEPGRILVFFGTGVGGFPYPLLADGQPSPSAPPAYLQAGSGVMVNTLIVPLAARTRTRTPGFVGLDQINFVAPHDTVEGCSIPLNLYAQIKSRYEMSPPVPISVRRGGGQCVDPPPEGWATLRWEKVMLASGIQPPPKKDSLEIEFASGVAKPLVEVPDPPPGACQARYFPPETASCPGFDDRNLDAGTVRIEGPGPRRMGVAPRLDDGKPLYRVELPAGMIQEGEWRLAGQGGGDVGPFETAVRMPPPIEVTTSLPPGTVIPYGRSFTVTWRGGDTNSVVRLRVITRASPLGSAPNGFGFYYLHHWYECPAPAEQGRATLGVISDGPQLHLPIFPSDNIEVVLTMGPKDPAGDPFTAPGLARGGRHFWSYVWRWGGLRIE